MNAAFLILFEVLYEEAATGDNLSKKVFLKIFSKFTEKHLCRRTLFVNKAPGLRPIIL